MPNPFAHIELNTDDLNQAKSFYKAVFSWKLNDMPEMGYTIIDVGKGVGGGMQKKPMAEAPTAWLPYVEVADVNDTLARATAAGGRVALPHTDIGNMGAIGIFIDPTGAALGVWAAKKAPAKKAPAKKAPAKKSPAKKAPAKKSPAKKAKRGKR
jgi:predicted enzyme related to lactoylglutathione lyase